ncbi:MAG TPA: hypothetical protein VGM92_13010, partial [Candidatus Kapabacteria bacterium]
MARRLAFVFAFLIFSITAAITAQAQWLTPADACASARTLHIKKAAETGEHEEHGIGDAFKFWQQQRTFGLGYIPKNAFQAALQQRGAMRAASQKGMTIQAAQPQWTLIGPSNIGGRINAIAINPKNPNTVYAGAANGGVWKTMDAGATWTPLTDQLQSVSMGSLGIDPIDTNIVFAGTGELPTTTDSYGGYGMLRSSDGGHTWSDVGPNNVQAYSRVIVNPIHSNIVYAAAGRTGGGVLRSTDHGLTWNWLAGGLPQNVSVSDLALSMNGDNAVLYAGVVGNGVYLSTDGGDNWTKLDPFSLLTNPSPAMTRIALDVDPTNWQNVVVLDVGNQIGNDDFGGLVASNDGGQTWTDIGGQFESQGSPFEERPVGAAPPQGWYDVYIKVDPSSGFTRFIMGGVGIATTNDAGASWNVDYSSIHVDHHAAEFAPSNPNIVYVGSDGGLFYSPNGGGNFSGGTFPLPITQFYGIAVDQTQPDVTYGGTQDNGSMGGSTDQDWSLIGGGDGTYTLVDPKDSSVILFENPQSFPQGIRNGNQFNVSGGLSTSLDSTVWLDPFAADQKNDILYWGSQRLAYSTTQGKSWKNCTKVFGSASANTTISSIEPFGNGHTVLVGTGGGNVYITHNNGQSFIDLSVGLPGRWISWLTFSPADTNTFYATCMGFGAGHVFKTIDGGKNWRNVSVSLPDIPADALVMDPNNPNVLYLGTDVGVFISPDSGAEWLPYGEGLPNTAAEFLEIHDSDRTLRVGTHGRSIWQVPLEDDVTGIVQPVQRTVWTIGDSGTVQWHGFSNPVSLDLSFDGGATWQNLAKNVSGTVYPISNVVYPTTQNAQVRVSDGTNTLVSALFTIEQQKAGTEIATVAELPYYLYDIAYDKDDNVLWATNFSPTEFHIYKIDPDLGTLLDSVLVQSSPVANRNGFTGIKYDPTTKHLFLQEVMGTTDENWSSNIYEIGTDGSIINQSASPSAYGTGVYVSGPLLLAADRMVPRINEAEFHSWESQGLAAFSLNPLDFSSTRVSTTYGPRGLTFDPKLGQYLLAFTDFQGTNLVRSYLLFLDSSSGQEVNAFSIQEGSQV